MASPAPQRRMTLDEFLAWDDGTDTRYELIDGEVVAMAPAALAHARLVSNLDRAIGARLLPPCMMLVGAGCARPDRRDRCYVPDIAVTCTPHRHGERYLSEPRLIAEVLSPSTRHHDRVTKLDGYREMPSVEEILFVWTSERRAQLWRRDQARWIVQDFIGDAPLPLAIMDGPLDLAAVYDGVELELEPEEAAGGG